MRKKIMAALLAGVMVLAVGCGGKEKSGNVTLGEYKGLTLTSVSQATIDTELNSMLASYTEYVEVDREAKEGDTVNINFVGTIDGVEFEGGTDDSEEGTNLALGSNMFIDGFEEGLIGAVAGEERVLDLTFPEDYYEDMAGKDVVFTVTVNNVQEKRVPELTDEFVATLGDYATADEFLTEFRETLNNSSYYTQITELLLSSSEVAEYPEDVVKTEKETMMAYYLSYAEYYASMTGMDTDTALYYVSGLASTEELETAAEEYAYQAVKNTMIMEKIAEIEGITVSEEEYNTRALEYALSYGYKDLATFEAEYTSKEELETIILSDVVMDFLIEESVIIEAE